MEKIIKTGTLLHYKYINIDMLIKIKFVKNLIPRIHSSEMTKNLYKVFLS